MVFGRPRPEPGRASADRSAHVSKDLFWKSHPSAQHTAAKEALMFAEPELDG